MEKMRWARARRRAYSQKHYKISNDDDELEFFRCVEKKEIREIGIYLGCLEMSRVQSVEMIQRKDLIVASNNRSRTY
jgi:hypothetical protein